MTDWVVKKIEQPGDLCYDIVEEDSEDYPYLIESGYLLQVYESPRAPSVLTTGGTVTLRARKFEFTLI